MQAEKDNKTKNGARRQWVWIMLMVNIVFILLLITLGIIALRVGNALPENTDILFIVAKNPSVAVGEDGENGVKKWENVRNVDIFKTSYVNGEGVTTIASKDGDKLIAPGTTTQYVFTMRNDGNMAVDYVTDIDFSLKEGDAVVDGKNFPLKVRLYNDRGEYLIGGEATWEAVASATLTDHIGLLGANSYDNYILELFWDYDGGNDEFDTQLGNVSAEKDVTLTLKINVSAEESADASARGGTKIEVEGTEEFGGTIRWLWLILLMINAAVLVFYVAWLMNKREENF